MKMNKKLKMMLNLYNLAILACVVIILISGYIIFKPNKSGVSGKVDVVQSEKKEITEDDARTLAKKQFKKLGEKSVKKEDLQVKKIQRSGEEYYYISSANNTMEIQISSGKITRINSATVEE